MAKLRLTPRDRAELAEWNDLVASVRESSDINPSDSTAEIEDRKKRLEADNEAWFRYYFAQYYTCEPAGFHKKRHGVLWGTTAGMRSGHGRASWPSQHAP